MSQTTYRRQSEIERLSFVGASMLRFSNVTMIEQQNIQAPRENNVRSIEQVRKGGLPPLALPKFQLEQKLSGQRGQATLPDLFN